MPPPLLRSAAFLGLLALFSAAPAHAQDDVVRARVFAGQTLRTATLRAHDGPVVLRADGRLVATLAPGETAVLRSGGGRVTLEADGTRADAAAVEAAAGYGATVGVEAGRTRRRYRGTLRARTEGGSALVLINAVPTEAYVAAVVSGEYPFPEEEGVKAQAVLARTYALQRRGRLGDHDVVDTTMDQVYPGAEGETDRTRRAADATAGEVLAYAGTLADVYYSSSNGGYTSDNDAVWGRAPLPYLRARPDPYDDSPDARWTARLGVSRLHDALSRRFGGRVTGFEVEARTADGRARWIRLDGARTARVSGQDFRMMTIEVFGGRVLRSTLFEVRREGTEYVFDGRGWGHGVGLSQYGARAQARQGRSYRDILAFYFAGTTLTPLYAVSGAPGGLPIADAGPRLLDPTTPTDPREREAMGIRTRPLTRREREAQAAGATDPAAARIEERLSGSGGWAPPPAAGAETPTPRRRTAW